MWSTQAIYSERVTILWRIDLPHGRKLVWNAVSNRAISFSLTEGALPNTVSRKLLIRPKALYEGLDGFVAVLKILDEQKIIKK